MRNKQRDKELRKLRDRDPVHLARERERDHQRRVRPVPRYTPTGWWASLSDNERADWLREAAKAV